MNDQFIQGVIFDWNKIDDDSYLKQIEALKNIERLEFKNSINFFVGENGSGKSTLLEAIAIAHGFNPEGGTSPLICFPSSFVPFLLPAPSSLPPDAGSARSGH